MRELKAHRIRREINELEGELVIHQEKCKHKNATFEYGANTGGYDGPAFDSYWKSHECPTCLKRWREDIS